MDSGQNNTWLKNKQTGKNPAVKGRILILLTNPRSGSTWVGDAIRCHPAVEYAHSAGLYKCLGFGSGERRYPRDLSNGPDAQMEIEMCPNGNLERIPVFDICDDVMPMPKRFMSQPYAIEKIHPEHFNYNTASFIERIRGLEETGLEVKLVYLVRDPKASITSFMNYQMRSPTWYPDTKDKILAEYMDKTYAAILETASQKQGLIMDYSQIATDLPRTLEKIYRYLWPNINVQEANFIQQASSAALTATSRKERSATANSPFLGARVGSVQGGGEEHKDFFLRYNDDIQSCRRSYHSLLRLMDEQSGAPNQVKPASDDSIKEKTNMQNQSYPDNNYQPLPQQQNSVSIAERLFQQGRFAESENAFCQILAADPANCRARNGLGTVLWYQNRPNDAIAQFAESLRLEPDNRDATWNIGQILLANGAADKAVQLYSSYLKIHPDEHLMAQAVKAIKESLAPSKTIWLVAPDISQAQLEDIRTRFNFYLSDRPWEIVKHVAVLPPEVIAGKDTVLLFGGLELVPEQIKKDNKRFYDIDHRRCPVDGWNWARLAGCYSRDKLDKEQTRLRFKSYVDMLHSQGLTKSYLFATGPSLEKAIERDWSDGYRVVCNTIVRDRELWNHINPHFIVAGDGIYHFGHTALPTAFRRDLKKRLAETSTFFLYPDLFHPIVSRELKEFSHRLIPVPSGGNEAVNKDLSIDFALPGLQNAIGLLLLPLGCTLSKDIYLWGFDGRAPDDKLFWSNSNKHSYTELIPELQKHHPGFFNHFVPTGNTRKYTTLAFGDSLENSMSRAEQQGWNFTMMHHSWTPVLAKRCLTPMVDTANVV